jgi:hypothetical protein
MMKQMIATAALVAVVPFAASAEISTPITVDISYDHDLLASDSGAEIVLSDIQSQAAAPAPHRAASSVAPRWSTATASMT